MKEALPKWVWGYYSNCGRTLNFTFDKKYAEMNADGYTWDNPRVRKVGVIHPLPAIDAAMSAQADAGRDEK